MKKVILTLLTSLLCVILAKAQVSESSTEDTLSQRVINGLEVIPIRTSSVFSAKDTWKLRVTDFEKKFQNFESKYPGIIDYRSVSPESADSIADWQDNIWYKIVPAKLKTLIKELPDRPGRKNFRILLYINQEGNVFAVEFVVTGNVLQALNSLPKNTMKILYMNLLKETCGTIKQIKFQYSDDPDRLGKEYITEQMDWYIYDLFGTRSPSKLEKMKDDGTLEKIFEERAKETEPYPIVDTLPKRIRENN